MTSSEALLDTDILSAVMRKDPRAVARARSYLAHYPRFTFSMITRFEILRGLKVKAATAQALRFDHLCDASRIVSLTDEIIVRAADIYASLYRRGKLIGDADILIAASALVHGLTVITNNQAHFTRIAELRVENWLTE